MFYFRLPFFYWRHMISYFWMLSYWTFLLLRFAFFHFKLCFGSRMKLIDLYIIFSKKAIFETVCDHFDFFFMVLFLCCRFIILVSVADNFGFPATFDFIFSTELLLGLILVNKICWYLQTIRCLFLQYLISWILHQFWWRIFKKASFAFFVDWCLRNNAVIVRRILLNWDQQFFNFAMRI